MTNPDLVCLRDDVVYASIQVTIERAAHTAFTAMGYEANTLAQSLELLQHAEALHASKEEVFLQAQLKYQAYTDSGIAPFNAEMWGQACKTAVLLFGAGSSLYINRYQLDSWAKESMNLMPVQNRPEATEIYRSVKASALGARPFNQVLFELSCSAAAAEAARGCGQSDVLWSQRATSSIDSLLAQVDEAFMTEAKVVAKYHGWMDDEEQKSMDDMINNDGCCAHGLDPNCCPVGCGDRD